jgi:GNAT superfamily N-acetyltransferase
MPSIEPVRLATPGDIPAIVRRWRDLMKAHARLDPQLYRLTPGAAETYAAFVRRRMGDRQTAAFVAPEGDDDIAGYILGGVGYRAPIFEVQQVGMIFDLVVRPDTRRRGVGRALVGALRDWFSRHDIEWLQVNYSPDNPESSGFWQGMGFRPLLIEAYRPVDD